MRDQDSVKASLSIHRKAGYRCAELRCAGLGWAGLVADLVFDLRLLVDWMVFVLPPDDRASVCPTMGDPLHVNSRVEVSEARRIEPQMYKRVPCTWSENECRGHVGCFSRHGTDTT